MKKFDRMEAFVRDLTSDPTVPTDLDPCYTGYFTCFNRGDYYEAHDVLEHLWLHNAGDNEGFYRGLIQIAGAFVHLKKQFARPEHPTDGRRLRPASRLFRLGMGNVRPYGPAHLRLDVSRVLWICDDYLVALEREDYSRNPWHPESLPVITLDGH